MRPPSRTNGNINRCLVSLRAADRNGHALKNPGVSLATSLFLAGVEPGLFSRNDAQNSPMLDEMTPFSAASALLAWPWLDRTITAASANGPNLARTRHY